MQTPSLTPLDAVTLVGYFVLVLGLGFYYARRASQSMEAYFLGGKTIPWWGLAMSGSVSNFDITGTMWMVSLFLIMGMKSMWMHWMWGCFLGAFCMAYMGGWVRASNVLTGAEWMITRFGDDRGGRLARTSYALMAVLTVASFIGYAFEGIGKFAAVYLPFSPAICALVIFGTTTFYVILGGLYSVVVTDVIQTLILSFAGLLIAWLAYTSTTPESLNAVLPEGWFSLIPVWEMDHPDYAPFGWLVIVWVLKGVLLNAGGPAQMYDFQRFLAAENPREAAKVGASWSFFLVIRWAMIMGITTLALTGAVDTTDPERVMPLVLAKALPAGLRGLVIAGLLAAFMSTFSSTVNAGASYLVRDLWQPFLRETPSERAQLRASYVATFLVVVLGVLIGTQTQSIAQIWNWMMMALGAGVLLPNFLRWYWWRLNGWGYAAGTLGGIALSLVVLFKPELPFHHVFPVVTLGSLFGCVVGSYLTPPVDEKILRNFCEQVRPFGAWGSYPRSSWVRPVLNTCVGIGVTSALYFTPLFLVGHQIQAGLICLGVVVLGVGILSKTWYPHLPEAP